MLLADHIACCQSRDWLGIFWAIQEPVRADDRAKAVEAEGNRLIGDIRRTLADKLSASDNAEVAQALEGLQTVLAISANPFRDCDDIATYSDGSPVISLVPVGLESTEEVPSIRVVGLAHDELYEVVERLNQIPGWRLVVADPPIEERQGNPFGNRNVVL